MVQGRVRFHFLTEAKINGKQLLKEAIQGIFKAEGKNLKRIDYIFCTDEYLLGINREFLKHDEYTDIVSFDLSDDQNEIVGEIYISVDRVQENAQNLNQSFSDELRRVVFHGALHLCGYQDKTLVQAAEMRKKEDYYLSHPL